MQHIIEDHEEVRQFVEKETGGFVESIKASSASFYKPTLDSLEELFVGGTFIRYLIKPKPTYIPERYEATYDVRVTFLPGDQFMDCKVSRAGEKLVLHQRTMGMRW